MYRLVNMCIYICDLFANPTTHAALGQKNKNKKAPDASQLSQVYYNEDINEKLPEMIKL